MGRDYSHCSASELTDLQVRSFVYSWFLENTEKWRPHIRFKRDFSKADAQDCSHLVLTGLTLSMWTTPYFHYFGALGVWPWARTWPHVSVLGWHMCTAYNYWIAWEQFCLNCHHHPLTLHCQQYQKNRVPSWHAKGLPALVPRTGLRATWKQLQIMAGRAPKYWHSNTT